MSTRTVHDVLPELVLIKVVQIERRTVAGSKMDAPSVYTLTHCNDCVPVRNNCIPLCNGPEQTSVAENLKNLEKNTEKKGLEETISEPSASGKTVLVPTVSRSQKPLLASSPEVEQIYQTYPRKKKPVDARRAIAKAINAVAKDRYSIDGEVDMTSALAWMMARVLAYAKSRADQDQQFTPYPAKWFNAGSYDEDFSTPPVAPSSSDAGHNGHHRPASQIDMHHPITRF